MAANGERSSPNGDQGSDGPDDDGNSSVGFDVDDLDDEGPRARSPPPVSTRSSVASYSAAATRRRNRPAAEVEFHGPWVKAVSAKGDAFYLETDSNRSDYTYPSISSLSTSRQRSSEIKSGHRRSNPDGIVARDSSTRLNAPQVMIKNVLLGDTGIINTYDVALCSQKCNYGKYGTRCEHLLGIIPGRFPSTGSKESDTRYHNRIMVQGLLPRSAALKAGIKIGDWLMAVNNTTVTFDNIDNVMSTVAADIKVRLTMQKISMDTKVPNSRKKQSISADEEDEDLVRLISGERLHEVPASLHGIIHGIFYLRLDISSTQLTDKEDIVYNFPRHEKDQLLDLRGTFSTLAQLVTDATGTSAEISTAIISDQLIHVAYGIHNKRVLLLCLPAARFSVTQLKCVMRDVSRILLILYSSFESAFEDKENHRRLDHFFGIVFKRLLLAHEHFSRNPNRREYLEPFNDILRGIRSIIIPAQVKILIDNCLSEFEAADFADMAESYYNIRRSYMILGSCLYYKGYLLTNHLPKDDAIDINLYLRYHGLLTLSGEEELSHLVVWREIFLTSSCHVPSIPSVPSVPSVPGYEKPNGRWFLLVVGMRNVILGVLLEAGGCAGRAEGNPTPDPFYIDQANATLILLEAMDVFGLIELRLTGTPMPSLSSVDWFVSTKGEKGRRSRDSGAAPFIQPPAVKKVKPKSILTKKNPFGGSASLTPLTKQERYALKQSTEKYSSESDLYLASDYLDDDCLSSDSSNGSYTAPNKAWRSFSTGNIELLGSDHGSRLFKGSKQSHSILSMYDVSDFKRNEDEIGAAEVGSRVKLTSGYQNTLFHYVFLDGFDGIYICPAQQEMRQVASATHSAVLKHFNSACLEIHRLFEQSTAKIDNRDEGKNRNSTTSSSLNQVKEHGILFNCPISGWSNTKKPAPSTAYWVIGRLLESPVSAEFYVCFHDSAPQNVIEMAFKLIQGTLV